MLKEVIIDNWIRDDLEGNLDEVIESLQGLKERHSKDFINLRTTIDIYGDGDYEFHLVGDREETKDEEAKRLLDSQKYLEQQKEQDLRQLEILKKKYNV